MPKGELYINGYDAFEAWGLSMDNTSLSALMAPPPIKSLIENSSRLNHGKVMLTENVRYDSRELTLQVHIIASSEDEFFERYASFCEQLAKGAMTIVTKYQPTTVYNVIYQSCTQFSQYMRGIAKFSLKLVEPDPTNRSE